MYLLFFLIVLILYTFRLDDVPVHLNQDELEFSLNAHAISQNLHDLSGKYLPLYFWHLRAFWATPIVVYITAVWLKILPFSESTVRFTSVFVGLFSIFIVMFLATRLFNKWRYGLLAGVLLATTPTFFIHSRILLDNLYTVPFVLLWLYLLKRFEDKKRVSDLFLSGLALGVGIHSYHAAKVIMPLYLLITLPYLFAAKFRMLKCYLVFVFGFLITLPLFILWLNKYPDTLTNQVQYAASIDESIDREKGVMSVFQPERVLSLTQSYLSYFSLNIFLTEGDSSLVHSTGKVGVFLFATVFFLIFGIVEVTTRRDWFSKLILFGFLTFPVAPSLINEPQRISRGLVVVPFAVLLALYGFTFLSSLKDKKVYGVLAIMLVVSAFQFVFFINDYFVNYPLHSYTKFNGNIGGGLESIIRSTKIRKVDEIYLDKHVNYVSKYFDFYQLKLLGDKNRLDTTTKLFDPLEEDFSQFPSGSIVYIKSDHMQRHPPDHIGSFEKIEVIREPDGYESFYVYYRDPEE